MLKVEDSFVGGPSPHFPKAHHERPSLDSNCLVKRRAHLHWNLPGMEDSCAIAGLLDDDQGTFIFVNGWMDEWTDGGMDEWVDGWMDG